MVKLESAVQEYDCMKTVEFDHDLREVGMPLEFFLDEKQMLLQETKIFENLAY